MKRCSGCTVDPLIWDCRRVDGPASGTLYRLIEPEERGVVATIANWFNGTGSSGGWGSGFFSLYFATCVRSSFLSFSASPS